MTTYTRVGSFLLAQELAQDPFGSIHRGIMTAGAAYDRHVLIRTFSEELIQQGMGTKSAEVGRIIPLLGGSRAFGQGYRYEGGKAPHCTCDYIPGRSLGQLIEKTRHEQIPFGVDHALSVIQGVAQGIVQMHAKGVPHGVLSPHSVWLSFEGAATVLDAPYASSIRPYLSKCPSAESWLAAYLQMPNGTPLQQDLFGVGAILYELLTLEKIPLGGDLAAAMEKATLKAAQEDAPLPPEIKAFLGKLMLGRDPFTTSEAFNAELERVLYDGDYSPTTFNMAFFMHTLFREENDRDVSAIKGEQADNYMAYTAVGENLRSGAARAQHIEGFEEGEGEEQKGMKKGLLVGGGIAALALIGMLFFAFRGPKVDPEMQRQLAEYQQMKAKMEQDSADLEIKKRAEQDKQTKLKQDIAETKDISKKEALQRQLEETQKRQADIETKKQELAKQAKAAEQTMAKIAKQPEAPPKPEPKAEPKPEPKPASPQQAPVTQAPAPVAPAPAPVQQSEPAPMPQAPSSSAPESPVGIVSKAVPRFPPQARNMMLPNRDYVVRIRVSVDESGNPMKASIIQGVGGVYGFDDAAQEAAMRSSFSPAQKNGQPTRGTVELDYHFKK